MTSETRGKCNPCRVIYVWAGKPLLRDALCPVHGVPLARTSHLHRFKVLRERPSDGSDLQESA